MSGTALDTNVVVAALVARHEHHRVALPMVQRALAAGDAVLPLPVLLEAYAVLTRLPAPGRLRPADAHQLLDLTFRGRARIAALPGPDAWDVLDGARARDVSGSSTHDAHIAACARAAGATTLVTFNRRHFERLDLGPMSLVVPGPEGP